MIREYWVPNAISITAAIGPSLPRHHWTVLYRTHQPSCITKHGATLPMLDGTSSDALVIVMGAPPCQSLAQNALPIKHESSHPTLLLKSTVGSWIPR